MNNRKDNLGQFYGKAAEGIFIGKFPIQKFITVFVSESCSYHQDRWLAYFQI
jgi:hypothetical protein